MKKTSPVTAGLGAAGAMAILFLSGCAQPATGAAGAANSVASADAVGAGQTSPVATQVSAAVAGKTAAEKAVNLSDESLKFVKAGNTVSVSDRGRRVATMALSSAVYTKTSGHVVFAVTGQQPLLLDTSLFIVYDSFGGENTATRSAMLRLGAGAHTVTLDYQLVNRAEAVGWAPSNGEALWVRPQSQVVNLSDESLKFVKAGNTVTVSRKGRRVATMALSSAVYTKTSGHVVFAVTGQQPLLLDTSLFIVYDSFGGENTATRSAMLRLGAGAHTVTLDYQLANGAEAVGWAPSNGEATWAKTTGQ